MSIDQHIYQGDKSTKASQATTKNPAPQERGPPDWQQALLINNGWGVLLTRVEGGRGGNDDSSGWRCLAAVVNNGLRHQWGGRQWRMSGANVWCGGNCLPLIGGEEMGRQSWPLVGDGSIDWLVSC
jgi:hypothetical protein